MDKEIKDIPLGHIDNCQVCRSKNLQQIIDMGFFAPCDSLLTKARLNLPEVSYPLNLVRCRDCGLVQIDYAVNTRELFYPEYPYRSGITETLKNNLHGISSHMVGKLGLEKNSFVIDIGSNDGTILEGFKNVGMKVLGVEATDIADIANANGIETLKEFFSLPVAEKIVSKYGKASLVTAANVFAHVNDFNGLTKGIYHLLEEDGVFISESHYQLDILNTLQYDSIYHEHLRYYLIKPLIRFFADHGFTLIDVERIPNYGGSIRVYAKKGVNHQALENVEKLIKLENEAKAYDDATYNKFADCIRSSRQKIRSLLVELNNQNKKVVGAGCPGRSATLLHYCGITSDLLPYIAEQPTCLKLGMYTPNTHIPVVDEDLMLKEQPDYVLMLSWHYAAPIIIKLRQRGLRSKIIVPLPKIEILG